MPWLQIAPSASLSYHKNVLKKAVMALVPKLGIPWGPSHSHQVTS